MDVWMRSFNETQIMTKEKYIRSSGETFRLKETEGMGCRRDWIGG